MSRPSILARLVPLVPVLGAVTLATNAYLTRQLARNGEAIAEETRLVGVLTRADAADSDFGDLKDWPTDLAVSPLTISERLVGQLDPLEGEAPERVAAIRAELDGPMERGLAAADACTDDERVLGNSLMAEAREHIRTADAESEAMVAAVESRAREGGEVARLETDAAGDRALMPMIATGALGLLLTLWIVGSITRPLDRLVGAVREVTGGNLDVDVPEAGRDEIGTMASTVGLLRENLREREALAERQRASDAALLRAQNQLSEAIEAIGEGIALYGADGRLVLSSRCYRDLHADLGVPVEPGVAFETLVRAAATRVVLGDEDPQGWVRRRLARHEAPGPPFEQERRDGSWLTVGERLTEAGGVVGVYTDITELKAREAELRGLVGQLEEARDTAMRATRARSEFPANLSHEVRTPMNAVIGMSNLPLEGDLPARQRDFALTIADSAEALLTIIDDILACSKVEAGKLELETEPLDLRDCVEGALDLVAVAAGDKGPDLAYEIAPDTPGALVSDAIQLRQVLVDHMGNAIRFTAAGEVVLTVEGETRGDRARVSFRVRDTGIGIPADRLDRLFQSFSQVDGSTMRRFGGTGLGLAVSQRLVALPGG